MTTALDDIPLFRQPEQVKREHQRRKSHRDVLRAILSDGKQHTSPELIEKTGTWRFGGRLEELRKGKGGRPPLVVHRYFLGDGLWSFRLAADGSFDPGCDSCPRCRGGQ